MERAVEVAILLLATWPAIRLLAAPTFHRRLRAHPGRLALLAGGTAAYLGGVAVLAIGPPWLLRAAVLIVLTAAAAAWWHARPSFGRRRGLPPGSLALMQQGLMSDDRFLLEQARRHGPVFKVARYGRPIACLVGITRSAELLQRSEADLVTGPLPFNALIPGGFLRYMAPADHARYRMLLAQALPNELVRAAAPGLAALAAERAFDAMAGAARAAPAAGVAPAPHLRRLTCETMLALMFGLELKDPRTACLVDLYHEIEPATLARTGMQRARAAMAEIMAIVASAAAAALARAGAGGPVGSALDLLARDAPAALSDPTLLGNLVFVVENGGGDLAGLLGWALKLLGDHPQWAQRLEAEARTGPAPGERSLAARTIAETLRLEQSEYIVRTAKRPLSVEGHHIPAGWLVRICIRESHRDPASFTDPDRFDPDRFLRPPRDPRAYAPLGLGRHACLGRTLVQVAGAAVLGTLARSFDWHVASDGPREFAAFHWTPSRRFRIAIARREATSQATV